jgi:hypothetical protein
MVNVAAVVLLGVPETTPVDAFKVAHAGSAPLVTANV